MIMDCNKSKINIGDKVRIIKNIPSVDGMLYENSIVKINEYDEINKKIRVTDSLGKVWWVETLSVSGKFL